MEKFIVTGGAGFIGSHIVDKLVELGHLVVIIDDLSNGSTNNINPKAHLYKMDITNNNIWDIFKRERPDYVIHHAAQIDIGKSIVDPHRDAMVNILGTINLLRACVKSNVRKIIYSSSAAVYGEPKYLGIDENHSISPISFYGVSKYGAEEYIKTYCNYYDIKYGILRYSNVYGPRQSISGEGGVIPIFINNLLLNKPIVTHGDGEQTRDFIYVKDIVTANILTLNYKENVVLNLGSGSETSINNLISKLNKVMKLKIYKEKSPRRRGDIFRSYFDCSLAKKNLNWKASYSLEEGLEETINYYKSSM